MSTKYLGATLVAFFLSFVFCKLSIPILKKAGAGQNILSYVKEHETKSGTPTMGGLAFIPAAIIAFLCFVRGGNRTSTVVLTIGGAYLVVGFLDDFMKKKHKENLGLTARQKLSFQLLVAAFAGIYAYRAGLTGQRLPFSERVFDFSFWTIPFFVFVFVATVNCVNLTDGLDALAAGSSLPFFFFLGISIVSENVESELSTLCFSLCGALAAYLLFNVHPASVFMGDTGSLSLGGFAAAIALFSGNALLIPVLGFVFVLSGISVLIQVIYYKATGGKRVFLMSPLHHHFQQKGYSESKISYAYFIVSAVSGIVVLLL